MHKTVKMKKTKTKTFLYSLLSQPILLSQSCLRKKSMTHIENLNMSPKKMKKAQTIVTLLPFLPFLPLHGYLNLMLDKLMSLRPMAVSTATIA